MTVLAGLRPDDVSDDPFPHVVVRGALPDRTLERLCDRMPSIRTLAGRTWWRSNRRGNVAAAGILVDGSFPRCWRELVAEHVGQSFLREIVRVLGPAIVERYPDFEDRYGPLSELRAGIRGVDDFGTADVLLDALLGFNTPVRRAPSRVRGAHVDQPDKLFAGLLYLRDPADECEGGDFEIYAGRLQEADVDHRLGVPPEALELRRTVRYERNTLVMFLNSPEAFHAVSPRSVGAHPRLFVNFVGELPRPLFEVAAPRLPVWQRAGGAVSRWFWQSTE